jgi:hypothetical protein
VITGGRAAVEVAGPIKVGATMISVCLKNALVVESKLVCQQKGNQ